MQGVIDIEELLNWTYRVQLAHLDQQPENCDDGNLKAMCQRCHNRLDGPHRRAGIRARQRATKAIGDLFDQIVAGRPVEAEE